MTSLAHKTLEAKAVATDRGEFTAIAAAYTVDRVKDRIVPGAFAKTIDAWRASQKQIPLHYDHKADPQYIIGSVDPFSMEEREDGLYVEGRIDLTGSKLAREAWRVIKANAMSLSFAYLATKQRKASDGVIELLELDVFEITVTPAPVQADTRFLSLKSAGSRETVEVKTIADVQAFLDKEFPNHTVSAVEDGANEEPEKAKSAPQDPLVQEAWSLIAPKGPLHVPAPESPTPEPLNADAVAREAWALVTKTSG